VIAEVQANLSGLLLPAGIALEYGGLYADQQRAFRQLTLVLVAALIAMFLVLLWEFGSITPAIAILANALTALTGSFGLLALTGLTLNISSFLGIAMVSGIVAKNGILLLDQAEREISSDPVASLLAAARIRLRPILMTTLATAAGLLAVAMIGGLAFALLLALPLTGGLYLFGRRIRA
jgi:HAE1 family hydrophobic/amphiphilic exporter-1